MLLRSIVYQSISGKAAATIFGRIKALGSEWARANARRDVAPAEIHATKSGTFGREDRGHEGLGAQDASRDSSLPWKMPRK